MFLTAMLRTVVMYAALLLAVRLMGKRQISQLQNSELAVTMLISELAAMPLQNLHEGILRSLVPMGALVLCELTASLLMLKSQGFRGLVCGRPVLVIRDGEILQDAMRGLRMTTEDLFEELRLDGVFSLEEVAFAVVETNGTLTVRRHAQDDFLTPAQAGVATPKDQMEMAVLSDGKIARGSLALCGKDEEWLNTELKKAGLRAQEVFLMTARPDGVVRIVPKTGK